MLLVNIGAELRQRGVLLVEAVFMIEGRVADGHLRWG